MATWPNLIICNRLIFEVTLEPKPLTSACLAESKVFGIAFMLLIENFYRTFVECLSPSYWAKHQVFIVTAPFLL